MVLVNHFLKIIDYFLNKVTMYKLALYYLIGLLVVAVGLSFVGHLSYNPIDITLQALAAVIVSIIANNIFAKIFKATTNTESATITGLILALIIAPLSSNFGYSIMASILAMATKYLITIDKRHLLNPAAASIAAIALLSSHEATWWVGTPPLLPFVFVGGFLLVRKIRREHMVIAFLITYFVLVVSASVVHEGLLLGPFSALQLSIAHSALFFFTAVMFTEPLTSPSTNTLRNWYAVTTAFLYATPQLRIASFAFTPEQALVLGNVFSYIISPNFREVMPLLWKKESGNTGIFAFARANNFSFKPGQYMEWTLPHKGVDNRGNRRYFSIASSPTEKEFLMAVKFYDPSSSYKKELRAIKPGGKIIAAQVAGDFVLPKNLKKPLVFIAGGVGIVPFRSMIQYIVDKKLQPDIVLFYANRTIDEIVFTETFKTAQRYGVKTIYTLTDEKQTPVNWPAEKGHVTKEMIGKYVPDVSKRTFYLSGPQLMVDRFAIMLSEMGVQAGHIKQDFFPGYRES